jgi:hypothetical protein
MKNMTDIDRFIRLLLAVALLEAAFFWLGGTLSLVAYALAAVMAVISFGASARSTVWWALAKV